MLCIASMIQAVKKLNEKSDDFPLESQFYVNTAKETLSRVSKEWQSMADKFAIIETLGKQVSPDVLEYYETSAQNLQQDIETWLKEGFNAEDYDSSRALQKLGHVVRNLLGRQKHQHLLVIILIKGWYCWSSLCIIYRNSPESYIQLKQFC